MAMAMGLKAMRFFWVGSGNPRIFGGNTSPHRNYGRFGGGNVHNSYTVFVQLILSLFDEYRVLFYISYISIHYCIYALDRSIVYTEKHDTIQTHINIMDSSESAGTILLT